MDLSLLRFQINKLPALLRELEEYFSETTCGRCARPDFYEWYQNWCKSTVSELGGTLDSLKDLQQAACRAELCSLEGKQAAKDAVDMEVLLTGLQDQLNSLSSSIDHNVRYAHLWRLWETKLSPMRREVTVAARKFEIALAGL